MVIHVFDGQLEFEFAVEVHDVAFEVSEHKHQSIEWSDDGNADVLHSSEVIDLGIVNDDGGKEIVVLNSNLEIRGTHQRGIHLDHLPISSDINHIRSIEQSRQNDRMPFQTEDDTDVWSIVEVDREWGLNRNTAITHSYGRNRERGIRHGVEDSNDLTDGVVTRRDGYLFTIGVGDHIGGIHIVEHEGVWTKQTVMEVI